jgi:LPXTG-motif cell wall-anchored protein
VEEEKSRSKAWIAGAVVGPLLGLALIGLLAFFFMRRKKKTLHKQQLAPASGSVPAPGVTAFQQSAYPTGIESSQNYHKPQQSTTVGPFGVTNQENYHPGPHSQSPYDDSQQWQQPGSQPLYEAPSHSPSSPPPNLHPTAAPPHNAIQRHFSSELEGN